MSATFSADLCLASGRRKNVHAGYCKHMPRCNVCYRDSKGDKKRRRSDAPEPQCTRCTLVDIFDLLGDTLEWTQQPTGTAA